MNRYAFRGSNSVIFIFASPLCGGQHLKERICSLGSKFFTLSVDPISEQLYNGGVGPHSTVGSMSDSRARGPGFDTGLATYFCLAFP